MGQLIPLSREGVALRCLEQALDRIRSLEVSLDAAMQNLAEAVEGCQEEGVQVMINFESKTLDAIWKAR